MRFVAGGVFLRVEAKTGLTLEDLVNKGFLLALIPRWRKLLASFIMSEPTDLLLAVDD